jgi:tetratricopeptide (TPR) repeat protein
MALRGLTFGATAAILVLIFCLDGQGFAQLGSPDCKTGDVELQFNLTDEKDRPLQQPVHVELLSDSGIPLQHHRSNAEGEIIFHVGGVGEYHARATGPEILESGSDTLTVNCGEHNKLGYIRIKLRPLNPASSGTQGEVMKTEVKMTSANELKIPADARKSFESGVEAWNSKNYQKAADSFEQATVAYPQFDAAFNNLGAAYMHLNQPAKAWTAFETAVRLNDKDADADRNFARLMVRKGNYAQAEEILTKALMVEPLDPGGLTLLSLAEMQTGKYDLALKNAQKVHDLPHDGYAVSHYIAGQIFERKKQLDNATAEYQMYLAEAPNGDEVPAVRIALARIDDEKANAE